VKSRVLTAIGLIPLVLGAFFCASPWPLIVLAGVAFIVCSLELATMLKLRGASLVTLFGLSTLAIPTSPAIQAPVLAALLFLIGIYATRRFVRNQKGLVEAALSSLWFAVPLLCLVGLHNSTGFQPSSWLSHPLKTVWNFKTPILMAVVPLWGGDTAAIFVGKAFGKHLLAPTISPKKTVEGAIANLLACVGVAIPLGLSIGFTFLPSLACGLSAGILGQVGDLFESSIKRLAGVKDSGTLLPGHGGLLDRIDSILFTAPAVYAIVTYMKYF